MQNFRISNKRPFGSLAKIGSSNCASEMRDELLESESAALWDFLTHDHGHEGSQQKSSELKESIAHENVDNDAHQASDSHSDSSDGSDSETPYAENVSSLFKNVVLVQAFSIPAADEKDAGDCSTSTANRQSSDEHETIDSVAESSVADIGREEEPMEVGMLDPVELLIDETEEVQNYDALEGVTIDRMEQTVAMDAPIIDPNELNDDPESDIESKVRSKANGHSKDSDDISLLSDGEESEQERTSQKSQMRKRASVRIVNVEKELLTARRKKHKRTNDDPIGSCSSSSSENVPNDIYFGASDRVFTVSTKQHWQREKQMRQTKRRWSHGKTYSSCDSDSEENEDESHAQRRAKRAEEIARLKLPAYQQQQLQAMVLNKQPKRDRFYDRSQDIPNDIYFGNVPVPLHILHATSSSSSDEAPEWPGGNVRSALQTNHKKTDKPTVVIQKSREKYTHYNHRNTSSRAETSGSQGSTRSVQRMKEFLKTAGFRHMRYQKLWKDCHTNHDRAEAILRFLQSHGLQGEPTFEKCRELRKEIQLRQEVEVLDTSVIIDGGEGRVTRQRSKRVTEPAAASTSSSSNQPPVTHDDEQPVVEKHSVAEPFVEQAESAQAQPPDENISNDDDKGEETAPEAEKRSVEASGTAPNE
uniref:Uncharacterized protein n=1 Tax=Anopheles farauti TaxID=69004 RepID=A0A182QVC1_9DIPT